MDTSNEMEMLKVPNLNTRRIRAQIYCMVLYERCIKKHEAYKYVQGAVRTNRQPTNRCLKCFLNTFAALETNNRDITCLKPFGYYLQNYSGVRCTLRLCFSCPSHGVQCTTVFEP